MFSFLGLLQLWYLPVVVSGLPLDAATAKLTSNMALILASSDRWKLCDKAELAG